MGSGPECAVDRASSGFRPAVGGKCALRRASLSSVTYDWLQPEGEAAFSLMEDGIGRRELERASALVGAGAVAPGWLTSPGVAAAAAAPGREPPVLQAGRRQGRGPVPALDARDGALGRAPGRRQRARGDRRLRRRGHDRHRLARGPAGRPGPRSRRLLRPPRHRAARRCSPTRGRSPPRRSTRRPVRRHRPGGGARRPAWRHAAGRSYRPHPARPVRRALRSSRRRALA